MSEETTAGTGTPADGQAAAPATASVAAPGSTDGQPEGHASSATQSGQSDADVVFDPAEFENLSKELPENVRGQAKALLKQLQGAYTKKSQSVAEVRKHAEAYQQFMKDPHGTIQQVAQQLGYQLVGKGEKPASTAPKTTWTPDSGEDPKSWQDVIEYMTSSFESKFGQKLKPVFDEFKSAKQSAIEAQLTEIDPAWKTYEDDMIANLNAHPTLAKDPAKLYRLSVPSEVLESRATQRAIAKMEAKLKGSSVAGTSTTNRKPSEAAIPDKKMSFAEAAAFAERALAEQGIRKGA